MLNTNKGVEKMRKHQTGEVILVMMVVMLAVMLIGSRHMGMGKMEEDGAHAEKSESTKQQTQAVTTPSTMPKGSNETQN